jgi:hypothetical protein
MVEVSAAGASFVQNPVIVLGDTFSAIDDAVNTRHFTWSQCCCVVYEDIHRTVKGLFEYGRQASNYDLIAH